MFGFVVRSLGERTTKPGMSPLPAREEEGGAKRGERVRGAP